MHHKYVGRREKIVDYRKQSAHDRYDAKCEWSASDISNRRAAIAAQQDLDDYFGIMPERYMKKPVKRHNSKPIIVGQHLVMMPLFVVVKGTSMTPWQRNLQIQRFKDLYKLRNSMPV